MNLVENGVESSMKKEEELTAHKQKLRRENFVNDVKALDIIQNAVFD